MSARTRARTFSPLQAPDSSSHANTYVLHCRQAESSLIEISELQTTLTTNLTTQSAQIEQLVQDSFMTEENVGGGNQQLKQAAQRRRPAKYLFYGSVGFSVLVVLWDLLI